MFHSKSNTSSFPLEIAVLSLAGIFCLWGVTAPWGVGLSPDSATYLSAARGLLKGQGLVQPPQWNVTLPMYAYPPFFSMVLAGLGYFGIEAGEGARLLNILLFGSNISLAGMIAYRYTRSRWASFLSSLFILSSLAILEIHVMAWSEPLFIFFTFLGLFLLAAFLDVQHGYPLLVFASLSLGLAFLTKYSGVALIFTGALAILLFKRQPFLHRALYVLILGSLALFPMMLWFIRNRLLFGRPTELSWNFEPYITDHIRQLFAYFSFWLVPETTPLVLRVVVVALFVIALLFVSRKVILSGKIDMKFPVILLLFILSHVGTYLCTTVFMGEQPFDNRALSPVFFAGTLYLFLIVTPFWRMSQGPGWTRPCLIALVLVLAVSYLGRGYQWGEAVKKDGLGYAGRKWKESDIIRRIRELPSDRPVYTNGPDVLYLLTGKPSTGIPGKADVLKYHIPDPNHRLRKEYAGELAKMREVLQNNGGILVFLNGIKTRWYYPSEEELRQSVPLRAVEKFSDGTIYKAGS